MFASLALAALAVQPLVSASVIDRVAPRWADVDQYHGKKLTVSNYTVVPGIFIQDSPSFNSTGYNTFNDSFGLIDKSDNRWSNLTKYIADLNKHADKYTTYKLIYIGRHGEGYHNVAESRYGTPAWNCYWSLQNTDGNITWGPDATLTPNGVAQAQIVNAAWKQQIKAGIPLPQTLYTSPMRRAASTVDITFNDILFDKGITPYVKEGFRESIGLHTCDMRSNRTLLQSTYPCFKFDGSFTEQDEQWNPIYQEQPPQQALRLRLLMNEIFAEDPSTFISITAHSGVINAFFRAIGHRGLSVQTGGLVPLLVKAVAYPEASMAVITGGQSGTAPICTANPTISVKSPATATVQPTWYPQCTDAPNMPATTQPTTGCYASPATAALTSSAAAPTKTA